MGVEIAEHKVTCNGCGDTSPIGEARKGAVDDWFLLEVTDGHSMIAACSKKCATKATADAVAGVVAERVERARRTTAMKEANDKRRAEQAAHDAEMKARGPAGAIRPGLAALPPSSKVTP